MKTLFDTPSFPVKWKPKKQPAIPESAIQAAGLQWLNTIPGVVMWRQNTGASLKTYRRKDGTEGRSFVKFGEKGACDTTGMAHGVRLEIEFKAAGKVPSFDQENYIGMIASKGGIAFWCDSLGNLCDQLHAEFLRRGWEWRETWEIR